MYHPRPPHPESRGTAATQLGTSSSLISLSTMARLQDWGGGGWKERILLTEQSRPMSPTETSLGGSSTRRWGSDPQKSGGRILFLTPTIIQPVARGSVLGVMQVCSGHHPSQSLAFLLPPQLLGSWPPCLRPDTRASRGLWGLRP